MLSGTGDVGELAEGAPVLEKFAREPVVWSGVETLQLTFEIDRRGADDLLPPGLHPTRPPIATWWVQRVAESPWGAFRLAQLRVECRSGLRPRGFLRGGFIDNDAARSALAAGYGYRLTMGEPSLERSYDEIRARVMLGEACVLQASLADPTPLRPADAYYVASVHLAHTPRGLRLVQVDPELAVERAERGVPHIHELEPAAFRAAGLRPSAPVAASFSVAALTLPAIRYVCKPEVPAFVGTERVDA